MVENFLRDLLEDKDIPSQLFYMPWDNGGLDLIKPSKQKESIIMWFIESVSVRTEGTQIQVNAKQNLK